ncbi:MAG: hypothetical protein Q9217_001877 [Psora testacea]
MQTNGKKRVANAKAEEETPSKRSKAQKKGTAHKVKKPATGRCARQASEEESVGEDSDEAKVKKENEEEEAAGDEELDGQEVKVNMVFEEAV